MEEEQEGTSINMYQGGVAGYALKKSVPSLVAGVTTGSFLVSLSFSSFLLVLSFYPFTLLSLFDPFKMYAAQIATTNPRLANQLILAICGLLTVAMGMRFKSSGKVFNNLII